MSINEPLIPNDDPEEKLDNIIINTVLQKSKKHLESEEINNKVASKLTKVAIVCGTFMIIEFVGGWIAGSLAIMSDAAHLLSDLAGFIISIASLKIANRPANKVLTYGYGRYEVIGALASILIIWVLTAWLVVEAFQRFIHPGEIMGLIMMIISICGLVFNLILGKILTTEDLPNAFEKGPTSTNASRKNTHEEEHTTAKDEEKDHLNEVVIDTNKPIDTKVLIEEKKAFNDKEKENPVLRAAIIHILGDLVQSSGVVLAAIIIYIFQTDNPNVVYIDPVCTLIFACIVLFTTVPISRDCLHVLMEATPKNIDLEGLIKELGDIKNVVNLHDVHVWALSIGKTAISAHILSNTPQRTLEEATKICKKYGIFHETIQVEDNTHRRRGSFVGCTHAIENSIH